MRSLCVLVLCRAMVCLAQDKNLKPVQYSSETFSIEVPKKNHFVMFFAPWCGHCTRLAPTWEELAESHHKDSDADVTIAKVDCTVETSLCSDNDVTGYPTLKFFKAGETEGVKFRGQRDLTSFTAFINEQLGTTQESSEFRKPDRKSLKTLVWSFLIYTLPFFRHWYYEPDIKPEVPKPVNGLVELTEETFSKHTEKGRHFVKFYAPWCGHCQKLAPTWDELAKSLEHDKSVSLSKVDCTVHRSACNDFEIKGYPTLLWIEDGKKVEKYQGQRTHEDLKEYVSKMLGSVSEDEEKEEETGSPVLTFSGDNFEHGIAKGVTLVKFFAPWCGHCKRLAPTWDELGKKFIGTGVKIVKVDCTLDNSKELCSQQQVDGFPTLFLYKDGEKVAEYNGSRSLDDLYDFVTKHLDGVRDEL